MSALSNDITPIFAESVFTTLGPRGQSCPHYPKVRSSLDTGIPSCLAFWGQESNLLLVLKTAALCTTCYASLVPRGYTSVISSTPKPLKPISHSAVILKVTGFDHSNKPSLELLNLLSTQIDIQSVLESRSSGLPLYCHGFHVFSRTTPLLHQRQQLDLSIVSSAAIQPSAESDASLSVPSSSARTSTNLSKNAQPFIPSFRQDGKLSNPRLTVHSSTTFNPTRDLSGSSVSSSIRVSKYSDISSVTQISVHLSRNGTPGSGPVALDMPSISKTSRIQPQSKGTYKSPSVEDEAPEQLGKLSGALKSPEIGDEKVSSVSSDAQAMAPLVESMNSSKRRTKNELRGANNLSDDTCLVPDLEDKPLLQPNAASSIVPNGPRMKRQISPARTKSRPREKALESNSTVLKTRSDVDSADSVFGALPRSQTTLHPISTAVGKIAPADRDRSEGVQASRSTTVNIRVSTLPSSSLQSPHEYSTNSASQMTVAGHGQTADTKSGARANAPTSHRPAKASTVPALNTVRKPIESKVPAQDRSVNGTNISGTISNPEDQMAHTGSVRSSRTPTNGLSNPVKPNFGASSSTPTSNGVGRHSSQKPMGQADGPGGVGKPSEPITESLPPAANYRAPGTGYQSPQSYPNTQHRVPSGSRNIKPAVRQQSTPTKPADIKKNNLGVYTGLPIHRSAPLQRPAQQPFTPASNLTKSTSPRTFEPPSTDRLRFEGSFAHNYNSPNGGFFPPNSPRGPINVTNRRTNMPRVQVNQNYSYRPTTNFHPRQTQYQHISPHHNNAHTDGSGLARLHKPEKHTAKVPDKPPEPAEPPMPDEPPKPDEPPHPDSPPIPDDPPKPDEPPIPDDPDEPPEPDNPPGPDEPPEPEEPPTPDHPSNPDEPKEHPQPDEPHDSHNPPEPDDHNDPHESPDIDQYHVNDDINQTNQDDPYDTTHQDPDIVGHLSGADTDEHGPHDTSLPQHENNDMEEPHWNDGQHEDDQIGNDSTHNPENGDLFTDEEPDNEYKDVGEDPSPEDGEYDTGYSVPEGDMDYVDADIENPENLDDNISIDDSLTNDPSDGGFDDGQNDDTSNDEDSIGDKQLDEDNVLDFEDDDAEDYDELREVGDDEDQMDIEDVEPDDYIGEDQQEDADDQDDQSEQDDDQDLENNAIEDDELDNNIDDVDDVEDIDNQQDQDIEDYDQGNEDDENYNEHENELQDMDEDQYQPDDEGDEQMDNEYDNDQPEYEEPGYEGDEPEYDNDDDNNHGGNDYIDNDNDHDDNNYGDDGNFDNDYGADFGDVDGGGYVEGEVDNEPQDGGFNEYNSGGYGETGDY